MRSDPKVWFIFALASFLLFDSDVLSADPNRVRLVNLALAEPEGGRKEVEAGTRLSLRVRSAVSNQLKARVFSGPASWLRTTPNHKLDDCWIYDAVVLDLSVGQGEVSYSYIPRGWLGVEGGALKSRTYFLVFELGDLPPGPIKIREEDVEDYFSEDHGYHIVVRAPNTLNTPEDRAALVRDVTKVLQDRKQDWKDKAQPPIGCAYITQIDEDGMTLAFGENCGPSSDAPVVGSIGSGQ